VGLAGGTVGDNACSAVVVPDDWFFFSGIYNEFHQRISNKARKSDTQHNGNDADPVVPLGLPGGFVAVVSFLHVIVAVSSIPRQSVSL
jgi:hypothetical protein